MEKKKAGKGIHKTDLEKKRRGKKEVMSGIRRRNGGDEEKKPENEKGVSQNKNKEKGAVTNGEMTKQEKSSNSKKGVGDGDG